MQVSSSSSRYPAATAWAVRALTSVAAPEPKS